MVLATRVAGQGGEPCPWGWLLIFEVAGVGRLAFRSLGRFGVERGFKGQGFISVPLYGSIFTLDCVGEVFDSVIQDLSLAFEAEKVGFVASDLFSGAMRRVVVFLVLSVKLTVVGSHATHSCALSVARLVLGVFAAALEYFTRGFCGEFRHSSTLSKG